MFKRYIDVKEVMYKYFIKDKTLVNTEIVHFNGVEVKRDDYAEGFSVFWYDNKLRLYVIPENPGFKILEDMIDVTDNPHYKLSNIAKGGLFFTGAYIEGTDGTGKTTLTQGLAKKGIITEDRLVEQVSKIMERDVPEQARLRSVEMFLKNNPDKKLIIMVLSDKKELKKRIFGRDRVTEYDLRAVDKQDLYIQTYEKLKRYKNIYLVDILNRDKHEVQGIVADICFGRNTSQEYWQTKQKQ